MVRHAAKQLRRRPWARWLAGVALGVSLAGACQEVASWPPGETTGEEAFVVRIAPTVVLLSIDGLAPRFVEDLMSQGLLPGFARLQAEGAFTHNARTEPQSSYTLPNHISMISGRPASSRTNEEGVLPHLVVDNHDPGDGVTVHQYNPELGYTPSVFDVVHDRGGYTSLFSGKSKFMLIRRSYASPAGATDLVPPDDGQNKIDDFDVMGDTLTLTAKCLRKLQLAMQLRPQAPRFAMLHVADPDVHGHAYGWGSESYLHAVMLADAVVQQLLSAFDDGRIGSGRLILTADHGGVDTAHNDPTNPAIATIPFYLWGHGVPAGDLYALAGLTRRDPGPQFVDSNQLSPIRNGDAANLALWLLGLGEIPGSAYRGFRVELLSDLE